MIEKEIINQSIEYIIEHLDEELTVEQVAAQFHFSQYYFNRAFRKVTGESVYAFIKRQKLNRSAMEMKFDQGKTITDIGEKYGYSTSNYSTAFKKLKNVSPAEFRKEAMIAASVNPFHEGRIEQFETFETYDQKISIQKIEDRTVLYERFIGNYNVLKEKWYQFMAAHERELEAGAVMIERFYDDPKVVEVNQCLCDLCLSLTEGTSKENVTTLKGGRFAVYRYEGKIADIYGMLQGIFCIWVPRSGYHIDQSYGLNIYRGVNKKDETVVMDLCLPIKESRNSEVF